MGNTKYELVPPTQKKYRANREYELTSDFGREIVAGTYDISYVNLIRVCAAKHKGAWWYPAKPVKRSGKCYAPAAKKLLDNLDIENETQAFLQFYADRVYMIGKFSSDEFLGYGIRFPSILKPVNVSYFNFEITPYTPLVKWKYMLDDET